MSGIEDLVVDGGQVAVEPDGQAVEPAGSSQSQDVQQPEGSQGGELKASLERAIAEAQQYRELSDRLLGLVGKPLDIDPETSDPEELIAEFEKDPHAFIGRIVQQTLESHPALKEAQETASELAAKEARQALATEVEDYEDILKSEGFRRYVQENPTVGRLLVEANEENDARTVAGILKMYKQAAGGGGEDKEAQSVKRKDPAAVSKSAAGGSGGGTGKIFSRDAIKRLIVENPAEYARLQEEIDRAYAEGRVR